MKIALDYDQTYSLDPLFWDQFIFTARDYNHEVRIVTARSPKHDNIDDLGIPCPVVYCDGVAKRFVLHHFVGWDADVFIDDKPKSIDNNSEATKEQLLEWRRTRDAATLAA